MSSNGKADGWIDSNLFNINRNNAYARLFSSLYHFCKIILFPGLYIKIHIFTRKGTA